MDGAAATEHGAAPSMAGYLYQCLYALLEGLRKLRKGTDFAVHLETLDDVVFESKGKPRELLQTKHHLNAQASLTDASPDLWRTLRNWCEGVAAGTITQEAHLYLVTTATAPTGSAAVYLRADREYRDVTKAIERLSATASTSVSKSNATAYAAYRSLNAAQKSRLLERTHVLDSAPQMPGLNEVLLEEVFWAVERRHQGAFLGLLEGWWLRRVVNYLSTGMPGPIPSEEIEDEITGLREQFKRDNLPIDDAILEASVDASGYEDRTFVHQLKMIKVGNRRIFFAIRDYFRAFEHRSKWVREDLLLVGELDRYEQRLVEEWEVLFEQMRDELGAGAAEQQKRKAAQALYKWVETGANIPIRPRCTEAFVTKGSYHILADTARVGWHPEFEDRLRRLLEQNGGG